MYRMTRSNRSDRCSACMSFLLGTGRDKSKAKCAILPAWLGYRRALSESYCRHADSRRQKQMIVREDWVLWGCLAQSSEVCEAERLGVLSNP